MKYPILLLIIMLLSHGHSSAEEINISNFSGAGLAGWETKTFKGQTEYSLFSGAVLLADPGDQLHLGKLAANWSIGAERLYRQCHDGGG